MIDGVLHHQGAPQVEVNPPPLRPIRRATLPHVEFLLDEWTPYTIQAKVPIRQIIGADAREVTGVPSVRTLRFENQVGTTRIIVETEDGATSPLHAEVLSSKFRTEQHHREFLSAVLDDLVNRTRDAAFVTSSPTTFGSAHDPRGATTLSDYHMLRSFGDQLMEAVRVVTADPHRVLRAERQEVPIETVTAVDGDVVYQLVTRSFDYGRVISEWPAAQRLKGYLPRNIVLDVAEETLDTPENRFVVRLLDHVDEAIRRIEGTSWLWKSVPDQEKDDLLELRGALHYTRAASFLADLVPATAIPYMSQVLLRRPGYQECWEAWQRLTAGRWGILGAADEAIANRDVATLYELWAFFALADQLGEVVGESPTYRDVPQERGGVGRGAQARLGSEWRLVYNQGLTSYSVPLRPDYILYRGSNLVAAFDAKFRLDGVPQDAAVSGDPETSEDRWQAKFEDIYKMHTYRDALALQAAVVVFPGTEHVFYATAADIWRSHDQVWPLDRILSGEWEGVGAIALAPRRTKRIQSA